MKFAVTFLKMLALYKLNFYAVFYVYQILILIFKTEAHNKLSYHQQKFHVKLRLQKVVNTHVHVTLLRRKKSMEVSIKGRGSRPNSIFFLQDQSALHSVNVLWFSNGNEDCGLLLSHFCQAQPKLNSTSTQTKAELSLNPNFSSHPTKK